MLDELTPTNSLASVLTDTEREQILKETDTNRLLLALLDVSIRTYNLLAEWDIQRKTRVYVERRITLSAGGFQILDFGISSDYYQVFIEDATSSTTIEIHYGEFLGVVPKIKLATGRYCQFPATSTRLLLRNAGVNSATIIIALTNRRFVL